MRQAEGAGEDGSDMSIPDTGSGLGPGGAADAGLGPAQGQRQVDVTEAARQLQQAAHDATVAYDCIGLGELARAQTYAITARAAVDAAEAFLRAALGGEARQDGGTILGGF
jgi:hypothetical protein